MRNHLDERALHRAWTENRLAGACVSQHAMCIAAIITRQVIGRTTILFDHRRKVFSSARHYANSFTGPLIAFHAK
jgi:hypothetical protein